MIPYSDSYLKEIDRKNVIRLAEIKAEQKGYEEGFREGYEEGFREGYEEGLRETIQEGRMEAIWEVAKNLLKAGVDMSIVAATTSLSMDDLKGIHA